MSTDMTDDDGLLQLLGEELHRQQRELSANTPDSKRVMALAVLAAGAKHGDADAQQRLAALTARFPELVVVLAKVDRIDLGIEQERQQDIARDKAAAEQERQAERERVAAILRGDRTEGHGGPRNVRAESEGNRPTPDNPTRREGSYDSPTSSRWPLSRLRQLAKQLNGSKPDPINPNVGWMADGKGDK
jgi:hypothetical protein